MDLSIEHQVSNILKNHSEYTREIIILLGVIQLCKVMNVDSFENLINSHHIKSNDWWPLINEIVEDDSDFEEIISGELYEKVLELQLWLSNHEHDIEKGSVLYYIMQKKNDVNKMDKS